MSEQSDSHAVTYTKTYTLISSLRRLTLQGWERPHVMMYSDKTLWTICPIHLQHSMSNHTVTDSAINLPWVMNLRTSKLSATAHDLRLRSSFVKGTATLHTDIHCFVSTTLVNPHRDTSLSLLPSQLACTARTRAHIMGFVVTGLSGGLQNLSISVTIMSSGPFALSGTNDFLLAVPCRS